MLKGRIDSSFELSIDISAGLFTARCTLAAGTGMMASSGNLQCRATMRANSTRLNLAGPPMLKHCCPCADSGCEMRCEMMRTMSKTST